MRREYHKAKNSPNQGAVIMPDVTSDERTALERARDTRSVRNYLTIFQGFRAMDIPMDDILPRQNVFTYNAWQQLGYQVTRGSTGVRVQTWIRASRPTTDATTGETVRVGGLIPKWTSVFHQTQVAPRTDVESPTPLPVPLEASLEEIDAIRTARNVADHSVPLEPAQAAAFVAESVASPVVHSGTDCGAIGAALAEAVVTAIVSTPTPAPVSSHQPASEPAPTAEPVLPPPMQQRRPRVVWQAPANIQSLEDYFR